MVKDLMGKLIDHLRRVMRAGGESDLTDGQLLEDYIHCQDEAAVAALVRRHGPMVWSVCRRILRNYHDAEDAFQATFLVLVRKAASIVPREMVGNWLYGVAYQTALKARATAAKRQGRERQMMEMPEPAMSEADLWHHLEPVLDQELSRLPDKYRVAIVLCDLDGKTRREVARQLNIPEGTLSSRLTTARTMLAKRLARHGLAVAGGAVAAVLTEQATSAGVPPAVVSSTIRAITLVAAGPAATGAISAKVAALAKGVQTSMLLMKCKSMVVLVGAMSALAFLGFTAYRGLAQAPVNENTREPAKLAEQAPARKDGDETAKESDAHYCWLVFGPKKVRALMRLKGDEVAVDHDGDGKFKSKGERFPSEKDCKDVVIADPDGKTSYVITRVYVLKVIPPDKFVSVRVNIRGKALSYSQESVVKMENSAKDAPQAHFHGPLTATPYGWQIVNRVDLLFKNDLVKVSGLLPQSVRKKAGLVLGPDSSLPKSLKRGEPTSLFADLATDGENSFVAVCSPADTDEKRREVAPFPKGVHPFVDVEFPAKQTGGPGIKRRYPLDKWGGCLYRGSVSVPADAGAGKARVTFSFAPWKGIKATSTTVEIPVDEP